MLDQKNPSVLQTALIREVNKGLRRDNHADAPSDVAKYRTPSLSCFILSWVKTNNGEVLFSSVVPLVHCCLKVCANVLFPVICKKEEKA